MVSESGPGLAPQYWQLQVSRRNRFRRLNATLPIGTLSNAVSEITSGTRRRHRTDWMNGSPSLGAIRDQSTQSYDAKSCGSITFAWSFHTRISDRATVETRIGCQERLSTSVGRWSRATIANGSSTGDGYLSTVSIHSRK